MFNNVKDYYPTPSRLIREMLSSVDFKYISSVLEPSAGDGRLVDAVIEKLRHAHSYLYNKEAVWDIDTVEIDQNLQYILQGKKYRVVHDNYLTYETYKTYDLIVANFPFSEGEKHLLKSLDMQERTGGKIVCLLNAETIKNPYSNIRKELIQRLEKHNAEIKYIENAFLEGENKTGVEVALITVDIPKVEHSSIILEDLRQQEQHREEPTNNTNNIINGDFIKGIIDQYSFEIRAGLKLIAEYKALTPFMLTSFKEDNSNKVLELTLKDKDTSSSLENGYIKQIRMKYWRALFTSDQFMGLFTSNLREKYYSKINELKDYDFSFFNIYTIRIQLNKDMTQGVEDTILKLFDEFSYQSSWDKEFSKNIHYYNGWKSNSCWKVNPRIIIRLSAFDSWGGEYHPSNYKVFDKLSDIEKTFSYLDNGSAEYIDLKETLKFAEGYGDTKKIQLMYFMVTFYKKGTCHIEFTNLDLIHKFNVFGSQKKGWIPPSYGKKQYKDMTQEEKTVIDDFEGQESYARVMNNTDYFIVETSKLLMLA